MSALDVLPAELWDIIFNLHPCNEMLLSLATVCRAFNERCIRIHFTQRGASLDDLFNGERVHLVADSLIALSLYSPCATFPMHELICVQLDAQRACRFIACLDNVVLRSPELKFLSVSFDSDLYRIPLRRREFALTMLCCVVSGLTERVGPTPVFICTRYNTFSCKAGDISKWNLHNYSFNTPTASSWLGALRPTTERPKVPHRTRTRLHGGTTEKVAPLSQLKSVQVQLTGSPSGSFVTFDASFITSVNEVLPPTPAHTASVEAMLAQAQLPSLRSLILHVYSPLADPTALRRFLVSSTNLQYLEYACFAKEQSMGPAVSPLIDPPLAHLGLVYVRTCISPRGKQSPVAGLASSPNIETFEFSIETFEFSLESFILPVQANHLLHDLGCIAVRTSTQPVTLRLMFTDSWRAFKLWEKERYSRRCPALNWVDDPSAMDIAQRMQHVCSVDIWLQSVVEARRLLTWLAALPDATQVTFHINLGNTGRWYLRRKLSLSEVSAVEDALITEAQGALPHVANVLCSVY
ncbi:hypothetical protein C8F01DRAFT_1373243 [Mycena amicta]|nr:hypothetical protein C8F01DRAFT_1373243 [Mycena amicta]